ncbi:MAG: serine--tRNA ligase, partial [Candidatus Shapirobacteria bacterium]
MIDVNLLRQQPELIKTALINRQKDPSLADQVLTFDKNRREILLQVEDLRSKQNALSRTFKGKPTEEQIKEASVFKDELKDLEIKLKEVEDKQNSILEEIPNIPADDVPVGKDENENV